MTTPTGVLERELTALVGELWDPDQTLRAWWRRLADHGLTFPHWPERWGGRGWARDEIAVLARVLTAVGAIGPPPGLGGLMGGPVVLALGNDEQRTRLLPPLRDGTEGWCQLFSEPGAGSDLAGLTTRAERDGDEWVVTGQKVWTSGAHDSDRGMLVARTDWDAPKHRGLGYFILPMDQPGVDLRPIKQMNGASHFFEVFLDGARVADADRIGEPGQGWAATTATLSFERSGLSDALRVPGPRPNPGERPGDLDRTCAQLIAAHDESAATTTEAHAAQNLVDLARRRGRHTDAATRQHLAGLVARERIAEAGRLRMAAATAAGGTPGPEASVAKLAWTESLRVAADVGPSILGPAGALHGADAGDGEDLVDFLLTMPSARIAGGSDEIQRNIIGERALGLHREPSPDRDLPFRDVPRS